MKATLLVYSGTGNSLWVARRLAEDLGGAEILPLVQAARTDAAVASDILGLVFPVHIWGVPRRVVEWVGRFPPHPDQYLFAVAVNGGQVAATLPQLGKLLRSRGLTLSSGFSVAMPSNYLPWGGAPPEERQRELFAQAEGKIRQVAETVGKRDVRAPEKGPWWQNGLFSLLYRRSFPYVPAMDKKFWADERCNGCRVCERVCPAGNVEIEEGRPVWLHRCEQCLACIQWCPTEAIQYGKKTSGYRRYHHPQVALGEILWMTRASGSAD